MTHAGNRIVVVVSVGVGLLAVAVVPFLVIRAYRGFLGSSGKTQNHTPRLPACMDTRRPPCNSTRREHLPGTIADCDWGLLHR